MSPTPSVRPGPQESSLRRPLGGSFRALRPAFFLAFALFIVLDASVFAYSRPGRTERISEAPDGATGNSFGGARVALSGDGRYVTFESYDSNLVADDTNNASDIFVRDRVTGSMERVSLASEGTQANGGSSSPTISPDGRYVGFGSGASWPRTATWSS